MRRGGSRGSRNGELDAVDASVTSRAVNRARASRKRPRGGGERTNEGYVRSAFNIARAA